MHVDRLERVNALIRRELGNALFKVITDSRFNHAAVTITHVNTARNLRTAKVLVSVYGDEAQQQTMLGLIRRCRAELQQTLNRDLTLKYTPVLHFDLDGSIRQGDRVLDVLSKLDTQPDPPTTPPDENVEDALRFNGVDNL